MGTIALTLFLRGEILWDPWQGAFCFSNMCAGSAVSIKLMSLDEEAHTDGNTRHNSVMDFPFLFT